MEASQAARFICWHIQEQALGGLDPQIEKLLDGLGRGDKPTPDRRLKPGTVLVREYAGERHTVTVVPDGYIWRETTYSSLSTIARAITGTAWNGPRFFGLRTGDRGETTGNSQPIGDGTVPVKRRRARDLSTVPTKVQP